MLGLSSSLPDLPSSYRRPDRVVIPEYLSQRGTGVCARYELAPTWPNEPQIIDLQQNHFGPIVTSGKCRQQANDSSQ